MTTIPSILLPSNEFLKQRFRHKSAITKGNKILSYGECNLAGTRCISKEFGKSCHAEINALKGLHKMFQIKGT
jgi:hypothetical protein